MEKYLEVTGKNEDAAIEKGLKQLGLSRDDVSVEVLERAKTGFLGIGSSPAKVKLTYQAPDEPVVEEKVELPAPAVEAAAPAEPQAKVKAEPAQETSVPAAPAEQAQAKPASGEKAEQIERFLTGLMEHLDNDAKPVITQGEDGSFHVELVGSNLGALIGRRGETLDAIQQLTNYSVNRGQNKRVRIHLDAENYRAKREETLERLARKTAGKALKYHRNMTLEPMNAYERHVIHAALQDYEGVTTYSTGSEPNRRVVVACER
mgnify:CR=1 FL=1